MTITDSSKNPGSGSDTPDADEELSLGYLNSLISDNETVFGSFRNEDGVTRIKGEDRVDIEQPVVTAVTDRRILFSTPVEDGSGAVSLDYAEIASISVVDETLILQTADGIGIEWSLSIDGSATPALQRHLCWIGDLRSRVRSCQNDVELAAGEIHTLAADMAWEEAIESYQQTRSQLDTLLNDIFATEPVAGPDLAPELTDIERTLEKAHTRLFIERAESQLELGRQLLENGDYEQGRKVLKQTQQYRRQAKQNRSEIERGDAFQFGAQRSLKEDIQSLGWKIETVAAEPVRQAHEAKIKAQAADVPGEAVSHWEQAFRRYGHVLTLEWGSDERNFTGDPDRLRDELEQAATELIDLHGTLADDSWNEGVDRQEAGDQKAALRHCLDAQKNLERAHELAATFQPDRVDQIASRLETMTDEVMRMRHASTPEAGEAQGSRGPAEAERGDTFVRSAGNESEAESEGEGSAKRGLPSASELAEMDTHHDITLDSAELQVRSVDDAALEPGADEVEAEIEADRANEPKTDSTSGKTRRH